MTNVPIDTARPERPSTTALGVADGRQATTRAIDPARMVHLEQLLAGIASHLQMTGNRHSDVVEQLRARFTVLRQGASNGQAGGDLAHHLALFEAQLISLAIRTGVPVPDKAAPAQQSSGGPQPHHAGRPAPAPNTPQPAQLGSPSARPPAHTTADTQPAIGRQELPQPKAADAPIVAPTQAQLAHQPDAARRGPIGAPPPSAHPASGPGMLALRRQSQETFEDAVAASQTEAAAREAETKTAPDPIFTYQPPPREGTKSRPSAIRAAILGEPAARQAATVEREEESK
ncbi:MAG: hypothetical protein AAGJ70_07760, partial [Pseudomonadota bacterium]